MQFSILAAASLIAAATAQPTYIWRRQDSPSNGTPQIAAPDIGMTMGCTVMANACKVYIKSQMCTDAWHAEVNSCVPATCTTIRSQIVQQCPPETQPASEGSPAQ